MRSKNFLFVLAISFASGPVFSMPKKTFDIDVRYSMQGGPEAKMGLIAEENIKSSLVNRNQDQEFKLEVTASEGEFKDFKGILLDLNVIHTPKKGEKPVTSEPIVLAQNGEETEVTYTDASGQEKTLKVKATRRLD